MVEPVTAARLGVLIWGSLCIICLARLAVFVRTASSYRACSLHGWAQSSEGGG
jgi:hypothetical protein